MNKRVSQSAALIAVTASLMALLGGCATKSLSVAEETPFSVERTSYDPWTGDSEYSYVDSEGNWIPFSKCEVTSFFGDRQCTSEDGGIIFKWTNGKGGSVNFPSVQVFDKHYDMECFFDEADPTSDIRICIPHGTS